MRHKSGGTIDDWTILAGVITSISIGINGVESWLTIDDWALFADVFASISVNVFRGRARRTIDSVAWVPSTVHRCSLALSREIALFYDIGFNTVGVFRVTYGTWVSTCQVFAWVISDADFIASVPVPIQGKEAR